MTQKERENVGECKIITCMRKISKKLVLVCTDISTYIYSTRIYIDEDDI